MAHQKKPSSPSPEPRINLTPSQAWWWSVTAGGAAIALGLGLLFALRMLARPLAIFALAVAVAASLVPLVTFFSRWLPRTLAIVLIYLLLILLLVGLGWIVFPPLVNQAQEAGDSIPELIDLFRENFQRWSEQISVPVVENLASQLGNLSSALISLPIGIASSVAQILLVLFLSFYSLMAAPGIRRFILSLFPGREDDRVDRLLQGMASAMGGYVRGTVINGVVVGLVSYFGLLFIGVDYPLVLGLLSGLLELIPVIGPIIAAVIAVLVALLQSPGLALTVLVFMVVLQQVENNILVPNIMHSQTDLSPLLAILALFAGGTIGGLLGAIVAIPLAAALQVLVKEAIAPAIRRQTGAAQGESVEPGESEA